MTDPGVRQEAHGLLSGLFSHLGQSAGSGGSQGGSGGLMGQVTEFIEMPLELAQLFMGMSAQLAEMVLKTLEEGGMILVKGLTPM